MKVLAAYARFKPLAPVSPCTMLALLVCFAFLLSSWCIYLMYVRHGVQVLVGWCVWFLQVSVKHFQVTSLVQLKVDQLVTTVQPTDVSS